MKKIIFAAVLMATTFVACKPKEKDPEVTKSQMLEKGKWKISELKFSNAGGVQNLLDITADCDKDNFYYFNVDKSITADEGATKCNASDPQSTTDGKWLLENNDSKLSFTESSIFGTKGNMNLTVVTISEKLIEFTKDSSIVIPGVGTFDGKFSGKFSNVN